MATGKPQPADRFMFKLVHPAMLRILEEMMNEIEFMGTQTDTAYFAVYYSPQILREISEMLKVLSEMRKIDAGLLEEATNRMEDPVECIKFALADVNEDEPNWLLDAAENMKAIAETMCSFVDMRQAREETVCKISMYFKEIWKTLKSSLDEENSDN